MPKTLVLFAALALAVPAFCGTLGFSLNPALESGAPGGQVIFSGTLTNLAATDLFLTDISYAFTAPGDSYLTPDFNFFFQNVPGVLLEDESYSDVIFKISIAAGTPAGIYNGQVTFLGGDLEGSLDALGTADFQVESTPEPGAIWLIASGLAALPAARKFRTRSTMAS